MSEILKTGIGVAYVTQLTSDTPEDVPVWNPNALFHRWNKTEIYTGQGGIGPGNVGRWVPKIRDEVFEEGVCTYIVVDVNPSTLLSRLEVYVEPPVAGADGVDFLTGVGPLHPQEGYFVYIDDTTTPPTMSFDAMACLYQADSRYCRVFAGTVPSGSQEVLSAWYNQSGEYVDDKIPLTKVETDRSVDEPRQFWTPRVGWAKRVPAQGDVVTLVVYNDANKEMSISRWIVHHGASYRESNSGAREIQSIELITPYRSPDDPRVIILPMNITLSTATVLCRVTYTDGKQTDRTIDGSKIVLSGESGYVATQPGIDYPLTLIYNLDRSESYSGSMINVGRFITESYRIRTDATANAYGMKLFSYPEWVSPTRGYRIRHFLQSIDRDAVYDVTDLVEVGVNSEPWDPLLYGTKQKITFGLDISKVDPRYTNYRHVQTTWFSLMTDGLDNTRDAWYVQFEAGQSPRYGVGVECVLKYVSSQVWGCDITCGYVNVEDWLNALYYSSKPLYAIEDEPGPLAPTHFILVVEGIRYRKPISAWDSQFTVQSGSHAGELAAIHWVQEVNGTDLQLATSGLIVRQVLN